MTYTPVEFRDQVVIPACLALDLWSKSAERLLMATAMTESGLKYDHQIGGPALGYFQMEPRTHDDLFERVINKKPYILTGLQKVSDRVGYIDELQKNAQYAAAMARIFYYARPDPLPEENNILDIWRVYKMDWNTRLGAATIDHFMKMTKGLMDL